MKRRLFNAGALLSLALGVSVAVLWVRSYWRYDSLSRNQPASIWMATSQFGNIAVTIHRREPADLPSDRRGWRWGVFVAPDEEPSPELLRRLGWPASGFGWRTNEMPAFKHVDLFFPHWFATLVLAIPPTLWLVSFLRARIRGTECCPACGYDLRGTEGNTCPECGATSRPLSPR